jgi:hypothetical protein
MSYPRDDPIEVSDNAIQNRIIETNGSCDIPRLGKKFTVLDVVREILDEFRIWIVCDHNLSCASDGGNQAGQASTGSQL